MLPREPTVPGIIPRPAWCLELHLAPIRTFLRSRGRPARLSRSKKPRAPYPQKGIATAFWKGAPLPRAGRSTIAGQTQAELLTSRLTVVEPLTMSSAQIPTGDGIEGDRGACYAFPNSTVWQTFSAGHRHEADKLDPIRAPDEIVLATTSGISTRSSNRMASSSEPSIHPTYKASEARDATSRNAATRLDMTGRFYRGVELRLIPGWRAYLTKFPGAAESWQDMQVQLNGRYIGSVAEVLWRDRNQRQYPRAVAGNRTRIQGNPLSISGRDSVHQGCSISLRPRRQVSPRHPVRLRPSRRTGDRTRIAGSDGP